VKRRKSGLAVELVLASKGILDKLRWSAAEVDHGY